MNKTHFQTVIVGGGIVGAGIFRDLSLHDVETLLVDAGDFSAQTSERSSKMLHGGIRYLENFDFKLVFEALHEKNLWLKLTPHLAREEAFYLPVYKDAKKPLWMIALGLFLYDLLSMFKNSPFKILSKKKCISTISNLKSNDLSGAGVYYDGIMDDVKITLEVIFDGLKSKKSMAVNHTKVTNVSYDSKTTFTTLELQDLLTNETQRISAENIIYALGPFTDTFLNQFSFYHWKDILLPSKGSHLWISSKDLPLTHPIVMTPRDEFGDRVIFVIPHQEKILVGTTEVPLDNDSLNLFKVKPSKTEIDYLLKNLNSYFPNLHLNESHIIHSFSGVRPLVKLNPNSSDRGKASREHKIYKPQNKTFVIAGGKYTTFRVMGQDISKEICQSYHCKYDSTRSTNPLRQQSIVLPFEWTLPSPTGLEKICKEELPRTLEDLVYRRLSVTSRANWSQKTSIDFDKYFLENQEMLNRYLDASLEKIAAIK